MKKIQFFGRTHMDISWRRCFRRHFTHGGDVIRPYADIEETLLNRYLQFAEQYGWKYSIEQTLTIKSYLERNPDVEERLKKQVLLGNIELLGGGETVIDKNLVHGESIYRNHYYSIRYYDRVFGTRPAFADTIDTFGLSAQLPQIYRQFGYEAITRFLYVFPDNKPYWRGLNGDIILFKDPTPPFDQIYGDWNKYKACPACRGDGCEVCRQTGIDISFHFGVHERGCKDIETSQTIQGGTTIQMPSRALLEQWEQMEQETFIMNLDGEETFPPEDLPAILLEAAKDNGFALTNHTYAEMEHLYNESYLQALRQGAVPQEQIDDRVEGNPCATGCYSSRIEIKKKNRQLEHALMTAEKLAALALPADRYPHKKLERLWNKMAIIQFHDCVTSTLTDAGYQELLQLCREVALGTRQIQDEAFARLEKQITVPEKAGWTPFVLFNPVNKPWDDVPLQVTLYAEPITGFEISDENGDLLPVVACERTDNGYDRAFEITFLGTLPPMGHRVFYYRAAAAAAPAVPAPVQSIENEFYRVDRNGVFDKTLGRAITHTTPGGLMVSADKGHAWGRLEPEADRRQLEPAACRVETGDGWQRLILSGEETPAGDIRKLAWTQTITLYTGIRTVFYRTEIDWEGQNTHIYADFPLAMNTGDKAQYEIPYGSLWRSHKIDPICRLGIEDEWPALHWYACHDAGEDYSVVLYNRGLPGSRVVEDHMQISLLRSPTVVEFANEGMTDHGRHVSEYALATCAGEPAGADPVFVGLRYNTSPPYMAATVKQATLPAAYTYLDNTADTVVIPVLKRTADHTLVARMYEAYGEETADDLHAAVSETDPLEETDRPVEALCFRPFEIKTVKIRKVGSEQ